MARGIGYAGEGDVLTAALAGAFMSAYDEVSFTEMFCPDWKNNSIFLSHMGEMNIGVTAQKPVLRKAENLFTDAQDPAVAYGRFKKGEIVYVNLSPSYGGTYTMIAAKGSIAEIGEEDKMALSVHGWYKPEKDIPDFLEKFSSAGGTHHSVMIYGSVKEEVIKFGKLMGWNIVDL
jgi:L-arabinose isomerase